MEVRKNAMIVSIGDFVMTVNREKKNLIFVKIEVIIQ